MTVVLGELLELPCPLRIDRDPHNGTEAAADALLERLAGQAEGNVLVERGELSGEFLERHALDHALEVGVVDAHALRWFSVRLGRDGGAG